MDFHFSIAFIVRVCEYFLKGLINTGRLYPEFTVPLDSSLDRKGSEEEQNWFACLCSLLMSPSPLLLALLPSFVDIRTQFL